MKFSCLQENLEKGLQIVAKAVPVKGSLPILTNILFATEDGRLKLSATNLETAITTYIPCTVQHEGSITIPAKLIREFVANLPPGIINAHLEGHTLAISSQKSKSKFNGTGAEDYPELPNFPSDAKAVELDAKIFADAISFVAFAAGTDDSRPLFSGIYLNCDGERLTIACTDGFRLSEKILTLPKKCDPFSAIIPARTLAEVAKVYAQSSEPLLFALNGNENLALFKSEDTTIATRILDGDYPDYKRIIPQEKTLSAAFATIDFLEAVKLTNVIAKEGDNAIKIRFDPEGTIRITSLAEDAGEHQSELSAEIEGDLMEIAFSSKYLLDYLNNIKTENIDFLTRGNVAPCIFKSELHQDFIHIIMPMQI
jgi:DNA polymerase III subunit beta